jgi:murein DD-endopeptidase MepM/ murein hydrolase activator NlpD
MAAPKLSIAVQPSEGKSVVYLPLAPRREGAAKNAQLSLRLDITNQETATVHASQVQLNFCDPTAPTQTIAIDLEIGAGDTGVWFCSVADYVLLPEPTPQEISVSVVCDGFTDPARVVRPLEYHQSPVEGKAYLFPARADDLGVGEYWQGQSATHGPAGGGVQMFAYDMEVVAKTSAGEWSFLKDGGDPAKNEDHLIWGKPIHAMADGEVVAFDDSQPTNPTAGTDLSPPGPVEGNHFYIQHGDELMLYAHLQPGTLPSGLMSNGAAVEAADFLGLAGNSGNSSRPHLHIHAIEGTMPWQGTCRPIPFRQIQVLDRTETPLGGPEAKWFDVVGRGLPSVASLIYPRAKSKAPRQWVAVDPLSLILSGAVYVRLTLPDPPPIEPLTQQVREAIAGMSREDRLQALAELRKLEPYVEALEKTLEEG